jgi:hypothetical protein
VVLLLVWSLHTPSSCLLLCTASAGYGTISRGQFPLLLGQRGLKEDSQGPGRSFLTVGGSSSLISSDRCACAAFLHRDTRAILL